MFTIAARQYFVALAGDTNHIASVTQGFA